MTFDGIDNYTFYSYLGLDVIEIRNGGFRTKEDVVYYNASKSGVHISLTEQSKA